MIARLARTRPSFTCVYLRAGLPLLAIALTSSASAQTSSSNCKYRASPPPLATLGGPATAAPGRTELALGYGAFGEGLGNTCYSDLFGGSDWFFRWRRGIATRADLGFDAQVADQSDGVLTGTAKFAARLRATRGLRLEAGMGAADSGDGRSVNADLAAVIGTNRHPEYTWNYYTSLRLAASHGCFNLFCYPGSGAPGARAPGAILPLGAIGATARVSDTTRVVMEAGLGGIFSQQQPDTGYYVHFALGLLFDVGKYRTPVAPTSSR